MKVKDLMKSPVITVGKNATVKEAGDLIESHDVNGIAVMDGDNVVGVITRADIFKSILPRYPELFEDDERCLRDFEVIEERIGKINKVRVSELMGAPAMTLDEDTPICKAGSLMILRKVKQMPVTKGGKMVGIITLTDICSSFMARAK